MIYRTKILLLTITLATLLTVFGYAWLRQSYTDIEVVERSELIVVGRLIPTSIQNVPHISKPGEGGSGEYHANLIISEVLKGKNDNKEIPIIIFYGLTPIVCNYLNLMDRITTRRVNNQFYATDTIGILDTGNSAKDFEPFIKNIEKNNLWFLRKRSGIYGREPGTGNYGIVDPEDLAPLELKQYYLSYLSSDTENPVRQYFAVNPKLATKSNHSMNDYRIREILNIKDLNERYMKLEPLYISKVMLGVQGKTRDAIISCGNIAGDNLVKLFNDERYLNLRKDIILIWDRLEYKESIPVLIDFLNNSNPKQKDISEEIYCAVCLLHTFKDPTARKAIELTRNRWKDNQQILDECNSTLKSLSRDNK